MGDVHIPAPPPNKVAAKVAELIASGHQLYSNTVTGTPTGRVRRPTLFIIAIVAVLIETQFPAAAVVAMIAIGLLLASDGWAEL